MAAHLRRNIRLYVNGNRFSPSFSPMSGARPFMGARSLSSSSMSSSPNQAPKQVKYFQEFLTSPMIVGLICIIFEGMDLGGHRSRYELRKVGLERKRRFIAEADLEKVQRRIEEMKKTCGRVEKKDNVPWAAGPE